MKVFFNLILIIGVTQLVQTQPLRNPSSPEDDLKRYYYLESNRIAGESCSKLKPISDAILADNVIKKSSSPLMKDLIKNITHFQEIFPFYTRFGHKDTLLKIFFSMVQGFQNLASNDNKDFLYIHQLLQKKGLNEIREEYVAGFKKILPKLEEFRVKISNDSSLIKWLNSLKECEEFDCYLNAYQMHTFTTKDRFISFLQQQLMDMTISFVVKATAYSQRSLKSQKLSQLSPSLRDNLIQNIQEQLDITEYSENIYHLLWIPLIYDTTISFYIDNDQMSLNEALSIIDILNEQGYEELMSNYRTDYDKFLQYNVVKEYENAKTTLTQEELTREKDFWNTFEKLKSAATFEERVKVVNAANKRDFERIKI